jgi:hypothetical protein
LVRCFLPRSKRYVKFAAEHRPLFYAVYGTELDKTRYPELRPAYERVEEPFGACVAELCPDDPQAAEALGDALEAAAHGHAMLLLDGSYGEGPDAVDRAAARAARVTGALIQGRAALGRPAG